MLGCRRDVLQSLKRRRPDQAHEHAYHSYWAGDIAAHHPFAADVRTLHTGRAYRSALIREHVRLRNWSAGASSTDDGNQTLASPSESQLPLANLIKMRPRSGPKREGRGQNGPTNITNK